MQWLVPATVFSPLLLSTFHDSRLCAVGESCGISLVSLLPPDHIDLSTLANHRSSATTIKHWYPLSCQSFAAHSIAKIYPHSNSSSLPFALAIRPPCQQSSHPCRHHHLMSVSTRSKTPLALPASTRPSLRPLVIIPLSLDTAPQPQPSPTSLLRSGVHTVNSNSNSNTRAGRLGFSRRPL